MFGKKKKKRKTRIVVTGAEGVLLSCEPAEFVPPEETILALCLEYFNDANPCHIHRSAVCLRAVAELEQVCPRGETVRVDALPEPMRRFFAPGAETVRIEEQAL